MKTENRGRPRTPHGARREKDGKTERWNVNSKGKGRWVTEEYFNQQEKLKSLEESPEPKPEPAPEPKPEPAPEPKPEPIRDINAEPDLLSELEGMANIFDQLPEEESEEAEPEEFNDLEEGGQNVPGIKGAHLLAVVDLLGSMAAAFILKKAKISNQPRSDFKLTQEEREELADAAQACADTLKLNIDNPWASLAIGYAALVSLKVKRNG